MEKYKNESMEANTQIDLMNFLRILSEALGRRR